MCFVVIPLYHIFEVTSLFIGSFHFNTYIFELNRGAAQGEMDADSNSMGNTAHKNAAQVFLL